MDDIKFFIPFEKKDSEQRIVEGYATTEALDSQGEVVKLTAVEKALPNYMKYGNIREMHQWSAVGKTLSAKTDESKKGLFIKGKIVDKDAWEKVKEGVYNGFSIGGRVTKKVDNIIESLVLSEISLVDRPANPEAVFSLIKIKDGKVFEKQMGGDEPVDEGPEEMPHTGIMMADRLVAMAASVAMMCYSAKDAGRETAHLEKALVSLKDAASKELEMDKLAKSQEETKKSDAIKTKLDEIKTLLERKVQDKSRDSKWTEGYFKTHREVL